MSTYRKQNIVRFGKNKYATLYVFVCWITIFGKMLYNSFWNNVVKLFGNNVLGCFSHYIMASQPYRFAPGEHKQESVCQDKMKKL
ncbi:unnamed protein product [Arctogadus glacialis]